MPRFRAPLCNDSLPPLQWSFMAFLVAIQTIGIHFYNERVKLWHTGNDFGITHEESSTDIGRRRLTRPHLTAQDDAQIARKIVFARETGTETTRTVLK